MSEHGMADVAVSILRWVDDDPQPGLIEFSLVDSDGRDWRFIDKQPIASPDILDAESVFPRLGSIRCEIISFEADSAGRDIAIVDTDRPWGISAIDETHVFRLEVGRLDRNVPKPHETETIYAIETIVYTATKK